MLVMECSPTRRKELKWLVSSLKMTAATMRPTMYSAGNRPSCAYVRLKSFCKATSQMINGDLCRRSSHAICRFELASYANPHSQPWPGFLHHLCKVHAR